MKPRQENVSRLPVAAMLAIAVLMVGLIAFLSYASGRSSDSAVQQSAISNRIENLTDQLLSTLKDAETGQRGFLITGRDSYLGPYNTATGAIPRIFIQLDEATAVRPDQRERIRSLRPLVDAKVRELAQTIELRRSKGLAAAQELVETDQGRNFMDDIRARCLAIAPVAEARVAEFTTMAEDYNTRLRAIATGGSLVLLGFLSISAVMIFRSLAHRERLYAEATVNAERFRVTLNSIGDGVIATDASKKISFINDVAQKLTGWSEEEAIGTPVSKVFRIVNETTRAIVENPLDRAIDEGIIVGLANHTLLIAKDGSEIPIDDSGAPIRGVRGEIQGAILVFRDISVRRQSERQLKQSNEQLKEFVDAAAHDLRTPLRSVSTFAQLLTEEYGPRLDEEGNDHLGLIRRGIQHMSRLLEDLLSYAQRAISSSRPVLACPWTARYGSLSKTCAGISKQQTLL